MCSQANSTRTVNMECLIEVQRLEQSMPWQGWRNIATWSSGLIINVAGHKGEDELDSCLSRHTYKHTHTLRNTAHIRGLLHWAKDPMGRSWLKSRPLHPGVTGQKFTVVAAKLSFLRFSLRTSHENIVLWIHLLWLFCAYTTILRGNRL